jgi:hypothetical protein
MIAFNPEALSEQKTTCSWSFSLNISNSSGCESPCLEVRSLEILPFVIAVLMDTALVFVTDIAFLRQKMRKGRNVASD